MLSDRLKSLALYPLPQHLISRVIFFLTRRRTRLKNPAIRWFIRRFKIDMSEAIEQNIENYPTFNAFFTRAIKPELRPVAREPEALASPVDGVISQLGDINEGRIVQAKGHDYTALELLGGYREWAQAFEGGRFITLYLAPSNYHRIHMPHDGQLRRMLHVPGRLFSVAPHTVREVPRLFARNERVAALFEGPCGGFTMVLVGALNVAAIETVWHGLVTPPQSRTICHYEYADKKIVLAKGEEMGRFNMGSTVILLTPSNLSWEPSLKAGQAIRLGQKLGTMQKR
ncbi:MAG TPA: archaetidylserine decarboxylase [Gammaproteobacteria bacterium]|nr:archaetidylserine decarboxylase [Gammaproteobacteria bacterium]